jgi:nicotinamide-nucleotide amidase
MKSVVMTIGDELLIGQVINTNAAFIAQKLNSVGIEVNRMITVSDDESDILRTLDESYNTSDVVIITGGLGPTHDDITKKTLCKFFKTDLVADAGTRAIIEGFLQQRNRVWSDVYEEQTLVPRGCIVIPNHHGTAPGELFEKNDKYVIVMPGVPYEMECMMNDFVIPYFSGKSTDKVVLHRTLKATGIPESLLAAKLGNIDEVVRGSKLAFLPSATGVRMRISVVERDKQSAAQKIKEIESRIRAKVEKYIYGADDEELEEIVGKIVTQRKLTLAIAESCTGGMIANRITNVPGSSTYFERGVISYSNKSKIEILRVPQSLIDKYGAVSKEVAEAMAAGVRSISGTDKPVGLVWIGYSDSSSTFAMKFHFGNDRLRIKEYASQSALELVRRKLLKIEF